MSVIKGRLGKVWALSGRTQETWVPGMERRLRDSTSLLPQSSPASEGGGAGEGTHGHKQEPPLWRKPGRENAEGKGQVSPLETTLPGVPGGRRGLGTGLGRAVGRKSLPKLLEDHERVQVRENGAIPRFWAGEGVPGMLPCPVLGPRCVPSCCVPVSQCEVPCPAAGSQWPGPIPAPGSWCCPSFWWHSREEDLERAVCPSRGSCCQDDEESAPSTPR